MTPFPLTSTLLKPDIHSRAIVQGREVISRVSRELIAEKKRKIKEGDESGKIYKGKDLLTLMCRHVPCAFKGFHSNDSSSEITDKGMTALADNINTNLSNLCVFHLDFR